jgi:dTDP-4-amino-4,6-dideoxygalactose transaminase
MDVWTTYATALKGWAETSEFVMPSPPPDTCHPAHLFWLTAPDLATRQRFIAHMAAGGIGAVFHYVPLHSSPAGRQFAPDLVLPVTERVSDCLVRLPVYAGISDDELHRVVEHVLEFVA